MEKNRRRNGTNASPYDEDSHLTSPIPGTKELHKSIEIRKKAPAVEREYVRARAPMYKRKEALSPERNTVNRN